jgi:hypothetical protein
MYNVQTLNISESKAIDAIFDACRANEKREPKNGVTFLPMWNGDYEATLRDQDGVVVAIATVDSMDV